MSVGLGLHALRCCHFVCLGIRQQEGQVLDGHSLQEGFHGILEGGQIVGQTVGGVWYVSHLDSRVEVLEKANLLTQPQGERLTRLEDEGSYPLATH